MNMEVLMQYITYALIAIGVLAFLGIRNPEAGTGAGHHTTRFDVDDAALSLGVASTVGYAWQYLKKE